MAAQVIGELCKGCGQCVDNCPNNAIYIMLMKAWVDESKCDDCEECVFVCINGAIIA